MAYVTSAPPRLISASLENTAPNLWTYSSADAVATVRVTGYITNGGQLGMKVGDLVFVFVTGGTAAVSICIVMTVSSTAPGAVDLSDGTTIVATNSD